MIVIGHSQGGIDARWAAAHDPGAIAAVVTVATPHRGSPVADVALGLAPGDSTAALDVLGDFFGISTNGSTTSFAGALQSLSSAGAAQFNADTPDVPTIPYFSVAGRSNLAGSDACAPAAAPFMATWDGDVDPIGAELLPIVAILAAASLPATPTNDGLVTVDSATWGRVPRLRAGRSSRRGLSDRRAIPGARQQLRLSRILARSRADVALSGSLRSFGSA